MGGTGGGNGVGGGSRAGDRGVVETPLVAQGGAGGGDGEDDAAAGSDDVRLRAGDDRGSGGNRADVEAEGSEARATTGQGSEPDDLAGVIDGRGGVETRETRGGEVRDDRVEVHEAGRRCVYKGATGGILADDDARGIDPESGAPQRTGTVGIDIDDRAAGEDDRVELAVGRLVRLPHDDARGVDAESVAVGATGQRTEIGENTVEVAERAAIEGFGVADHDTRGVDRRRDRGRTRRRPYRRHDTRGRADEGAGKRVADDRSGVVDPGRAGIEAQIGENPVGHDESTKVRVGERRIVPHDHSARVDPGRFIARRVESRQRRHPTAGVNECLGHLSRGGVEAHHHAGSVDRVCLRIRTTEAAQIRDGVAGLGDTERVQRQEKGEAEEGRRGGSDVQSGEGRQVHGGAKKQATTQHGISKRGNSAGRRP